MCQTSFSGAKNCEKMVYIFPSYQGNGFSLAITPMHNAAAINSLPYILEAGRGQSYSRVRNN